MRGVFLDADSLNHNDLDFSGLQATLPQWHIHGTTEAGQVVERIHDAEVVVSNKVMLNEAAIASAPQLRLIAIAATGTNNVDLTAANRHGVTVCNIRRYATPSVVQHVFTLLLALTRHLPDYQKAVDNGEWQRSPQFCLLDYPIRELCGLTLGIVGYGELGRAVAETAERAFGMKILLAQRPGGSPQAGRLTLEQLLPQVDVLTLHCPLTPETKGLIGTTELALMKPDALLINTARGGIVDETALADALIAGRLGGAGIDVLAEEPPADDNPLLKATVPNLIITPHIAWASREARQRLTDQLTENIRLFFAGTPQHIVIQ